jgi:Glycosyltransferase family 9 (heptosyltransferase)
MTNTEKQTLDFLHACALDKNRPLAETEQAILNAIHCLLKQADEIIICLGGKAGRLGECIVGTALLEGTLQALQHMNKVDTPICVFVDEGVAGLFDAKLYQDAHCCYFNPSREAADVQQCAFFQSLFQSLTGSRRTQVIGHWNVVVLDFHGANDGMPYLQLIENPSLQEAQTGQDQHSRIAIIGQLFRVGVRSYADRGPERRYADFIETLFALPAGTIDGKQAQPRIRLADDENARYYELAQTLGLNPDALFIIGFFQSVVPAKCYERWDEVLQLLCVQLACHVPGQKIDIVLACGPDADLPQGIREADIEEWLGNFQGVEANARVLVCSTPSLRDLALLTSHAVLALSNDTGPGHIAGALGIPTVTPFLPGTIYSKKVWSSTLYHYGVTLEPNPYSFRTLEAAVIWGKTDIMNSVEPEHLSNAAWKQLQIPLAGAEL